MTKILFLIHLSCLVMMILPSCKENNSKPSQQVVQSLDLKRGDIISCGPSDQKLGSIAFDISGSQKVRDDFNLAVKLLHSFEYDEAEKVFARIVDEDAGCAMAYWGIAMSNFHALWTPPTEPELVKGSKAVKIAKSIKNKTEKEEGYINAIAAFFSNWQNVDHKTRCLNFEKEMENLHNQYPTDREATIFYALALNAAANPDDKTFSKQKKAGDLLNKLYPSSPDHPGVVHYIIHTYDSPGLAELALPAARKYASVAPSSAHALHMPSHIFTRLGLWQECINSNLAAVASAKCYAEQAKIKGHWDEELHGMDYLVYAYLQTGQNEQAMRQWNYLKTINEVSPFNFKVAYAFASIPSRYLLENKLWKEAASLTVHKADMKWENFQWQKAILHFTRALGSVHIKNIAAAKLELNELKNIHTNILKQKDAYKANQVDVQLKAIEAWIAFGEGNNADAVRLMNLSADLEDKTEKHPVTPGEVLPAKELLGDLLMEIKKPAEALKAYEASLLKHPNRFNGLYGAAIAAEKSGNVEKAKAFFQKLSSTSYSENSARAELKTMTAFLQSH